MVNPTVHSGDRAEDKVICNIGLDSSKYRNVLDLSGKILLVGPAAVASCKRVLKLQHVGQNQFQLDLKESSSYPTLS